VNSPDAGERLRQLADHSPLESAAELEKLRSEVIAAGMKASAPVVDDLRRAGFDVATIEDLYQKKLSYESAIPILLKWLPLIQNRVAKVQIVYALAAPWAKRVAARPLIREFRSDPSLRWEIADVLCRVADVSVVDDIIGLVDDPASDTSRQMLTLCLGEIKDPRAVATVSRLLKDDAVAGHAVMAAGKLKAVSLRPQLEPFLNDPRAWVRREARKSLAQLDKAAAPKPKRADSREP
jgi:HEAT repeat protein